MGTPESNELPTTQHHITEESDADSLSQIQLVLPIRNGLYKPSQPTIDNRLPEKRKPEGETGDPVPDPGWDDGGCEEQGRKDGAGEFEAGDVGRVWTRRGEGTAETLAGLTYTSEDSLRETFRQVGNIASDVLHGLCILAVCTSATVDNAEFPTHLIIASRFAFASLVSACFLSFSDIGLDTSLSPFFRCTILPVIPPVSSPSRAALSLRRWCLSSSGCSPGAYNDGSSSACASAYSSSESE